jgi:hypothetical protein
VLALVLGDVVPAITGAILLLLGKDGMSVGKQFNYLVLREEEKGKQGRRQSIEQWKCENFEQNAIAK